jgi:diphthamide biosynthesis methyltransferase
VENLFPCFYLNTISYKKLKLQPSLILISRKQNQIVKTVVLIKRQLIKYDFVNSLDEALKKDIDIFIEATGDPIIGTEHAVKVIQ